jgi:hypothetical protein
MGLGLGYFRVRTQRGVGWVRSPDPRGLSLGSASKPKMGFGVGPSLSGPKRVGVWVLPWPNQRVFGLGYASKPKTCESLDPRKGSMSIDPLAWLGNRFAGLAQH